MSGPAHKPQDGLSTLAAETIGVTLGGRAVLDGVTVALRPGEVTAVIGPNGAGKSTLLACLAGLRRPGRGLARLDGAPVLDRPARERARAVAYLEQIPEIAWAVDVRTLVGLGRTPFTGARGLSADDLAAVDAALARTGVTAFADRLVTTLSGGERSRVLLARALAGEPRWLLADEPLAGLDPGHAFDACDLFRAVAAAGAGVVLTLHDLPLAARVADRVLVLDGGRLVADGPPADALTPERLAAVYGVEAAVAPGPRGLRVELLGRRHA